jgi:UDPglucose--hexose-1-phosphate uridylyltransferase
VGTEPTQTGGGQLVWKNSARLADGREIIYFDESPGLNRALARDTRDGLVPVPTPGAWRPESPEQAVRWDPLLGEWVVIAAQRQDRTFLPPPDQCPLDPSAPGRPTEIPADSYAVVVFENRFPSLRGASALPGTEAADQAGPALDDGLSPQRPGYGRCEVVCFTSVHNASFASLTPRRVRTVVEAWADRTATLSAMDGIEQVYCFENTPAPYIAAWHQAPVTDSVARAEFGLHLQVFTVRRAPGKLKYLAGTESGMGVWINDIVPETAARRLREAG